MMTRTPESVELAARRARARRTAAFVTLAAVGVYLLFWIGGVLRA
jgi:hypothetical protein